MLLERDLDLSLLYENQKKMLVEGNQEYVLHVKGVVPISIKLVNVREKRGQEQLEQRSATVLFC